MKKWILFILLLIINPMIVSAEDIVNGEYGNYEDAIKIVQESMKAYYLRGPYFQYNYSKATYGTEAPEEATSQDHKYGVCAAYTYDVYTEAFGMKYVDKKSTFPRYNYNIIEEAYKKYNSQSNLDGTFLIYYQSTVDTADSSRNRKIVKYVYGDNTPSSDTNDYETLVNNIRPGDLFVYTGHALIAYDVVVNPNTHKKDVLILNSTADEYIRTRIDGTSKLSYDMFQSSKGSNSHLDINQEGSIKWLWLSEIRSFVNKNGILKCTKEECAVIRPVYEKNGKAIFNYYITPSQYQKGHLRTEYPGLMIEKTVNVSDNDSVYINDELIYTIKITNKSNTNYKSVTYNSFSVEEKIENYVSYISSTENGKFKDGKIIWNINNLKANSTINLTYKVKIKNDVSLIGKTISSTGKFYKTNNNKIYLTTGTVKNTIIPKIAQINKPYKDCYNNNKNKYSGLTLINEIYKCSSGINYNFESFSFKKLFTKTIGSTPKTTSKIIINTGLDSKHTLFNKMILNNYFNGLVTKNDKYYLPRFTSSSSTRAKTIISSDFKNGDVLIYEITSSKFTKENGIYAFIYIDGKFIGVNGNGISQRNEFTYNYYANNNPVSQSICDKYNYSYGTTCNYAYNLYGGYSKLTDNNTKTKVLEFVNYQTLMEKDNYIILRPEKVMREIVDLSLTQPTKTTYIKNEEKLDLTGGKLLVKYNDGINEEFNLTNIKDHISGFNNSKIGTNTITIEYEGHKINFEVQIISDKKPELGTNNSRPGTNQNPPSETETPNKDDNNKEPELNDSKTEINDSQLTTNDSINKDNKIITAVVISIIVLIVCIWCSQFFDKQQK